MPKKRYATALEWCMDALNNPRVSVELKVKIAAVAIGYQTPRIESIKGPGKKAAVREAAEKAVQVTDFEPAQAPVHLS